MYKRQERGIELLHSLLEHLHAPFDVVLPLAFEKTLSKRPANVVVKLAEGVLISSIFMEDCAPILLILRLSLIHI